ncbi:hypothetical protein OAO87_01200 [bacterium]|nr:hypothetical protein [bacterium]
MMFIENVSSNDHTRVIVPPLPFSASGGQRLALTLTSFAIRRTWYNINPTNNRFLLLVDTTAYLITIAPGAYATFEDLSLAMTHKRSRRP